MVWHTWSSMNFTGKPLSLWIFPWQLFFLFFPPPRGGSCWAMLSSLRCGFTEKCCTHSFSTLTGHPSLLAPEKCSKQRVSWDKPPSTCAGCHPAVWIWISRIPTLAVDLKENVMRGTWSLLKTTCCSDSSPDRQAVMQAVKTEPFTVTCSPFALMVQEYESQDPGVSNCQHISFKSCFTCCCFRGYTNRRNAHEIFF